jgi:hypothetical protein
VWELSPFMMAVLGIPSTSAGADTVYRIGSSDDRPLLSLENAVGKFDGGEVPSEDPVDEGWIIVVSLLVVTVPDRELVGDLEERSLVLRG